MDDKIPYILFYSANIAFIITNLYGWILKVFYKAEPYRDNYDNLFPSQRANKTLYLLQIFEIPYLLMLPNPKVLFYVNAFSILIFSSLMVVMIDSYFFLKRKNNWQSIGYFLPVVIIVFYLLLAALELINTTDGTYRIMFWIVTFTFIYYAVRLIIVRGKIRRCILAIDEGTYSNIDDFPAHYAKRLEWVPISICILMYACFLLNDPSVKMWRDLLFTVVNIWFLIYNLNPRRKGVVIENSQEQALEQMLIETDEPSPKYKLSVERYSEIESKLIELIEKEMLFLDSHLNLDQLAQKMGINRNYISEVISRSDYGSFYMLINSYRIEYAQDILRKKPTMKIKNVAYDSGFSSVSIFSQVFKRYKKITPSEFAKTLINDSAEAK